MQVTLPQSDIDAVLAYTFSTNGADTGALEISQEFEVVSVNSVDSTSDEVWHILDALHERQYQAFECFITDRLRDRIR